MVGSSLVDLLAFWYPLTPTDHFLSFSGPPSLVVGTPSPTLASSYTLCTPAPAMTRSARGTLPSATSKGSLLLFLCVWRAAHWAALVSTDSPRNQLCRGSTQTSLEIG